jgi:hypothetical protein
MEKYIRPDELQNYRQRRKKHRIDSAKQSAVATVVFGSFITSFLWFMWALAQEDTSIASRDFLAPRGWLLAGWFAFHYHRVRWPSEY